MKAGKLQNNMTKSLDAFLDYLQADKRYSPLTIVAYRQDMADFVAYVGETFGQTEWTAVGRMELRSYVAFLAEKGMKPYSIRRKVSALRSFFRYEIKAGRMKENPTTKLPLPKAGKRLVYFVEESGMRQLDREEAAKAQAGASAGVAASSLATVSSATTSNTTTLSATTEPNAHTAGRKPKQKTPFETYRDYLVLTLFYGTGIRLAELLSLKDRKVDTRQAVLTVLGKRNKERQIPLHALLCEDIEIYRKMRADEVGVPKSDCFFVNLQGSPMSRSAVYRLVHTCLRKYTTIDKCSPHVLRHTFATHLLNEGADLDAVKTLLGHSSLASTQVYTHNTIEKLKKAYAMAHPKA